MNLYLSLAIPTARKLVGKEVGTKYQSAVCGKRCDEFNEELPLKCQNFQKFQ